MSAPVTLGKVCAKCGEDKSLSDFHKVGGKNRGYRGVCKQCRRIEDLDAGRVEVRCVICNRVRTVIAKHHKRAAARRCPECSRVHANVSLPRRSGRKGGFSVRWETDNGPRYRDFATREEASRFRRALLATEAPNRAKDPLGQTYNLIRQALSATDAARLSVRETDELMTALYEAEDIAAALIRRRAYSDK